MAVRGKVADMALTLARANANISQALRLKFDARLAEQRRLRQKDTGIVSFRHDGFLIKGDRSKSVKWDQEMLAKLWDEIIASGDKPENYIKITYAVGEREYSAWPEFIKTMFEPARTVTTGQETITVESYEE